MTGKNGPTPKVPNAANSKPSQEVVGELTAQPFFASPSRAFFAASRALRFSRLLTFSSFVEFAATASSPSRPTSLSSWRGLHVHRFTIFFGGLGSPSVS